MFIKTLAATILLAPLLAIPALAGDDDDDRRSFRKGTVIEAPAKGGMKTIVVCEDDDDDDDCYRVRVREDGSSGRDGRGRGWDDDRYDD